MADVGTMSSSRPPGVWFSGGRRVRACAPGCDDGSLLCLDLRGSYTRVAAARGARGPRHLGSGRLMCLSHLGSAVAWEDVFCLPRGLCSSRYRVGASSRARAAGYSSGFLPSTFVAGAVSPPVQAYVASWLCAPGLLCGQRTRGCGTCSSRGDTSTATAPSQVVGLLSPGAHFGSVARSARDAGVCECCVSAPVCVYAAG